MQLGRVVGCVWATAKNSSLEGYRLLVVQPISTDLRDTGKALVCTDWTGAGAGETIRVFEAFSDIDEARFVAFGALGCWVEGRSHPALAEQMTVRWH